MNTAEYYTITKKEYHEAIHEDGGSRIIDRYILREIDTHAACQILGVCEKTISNYIKNGILKPINPGSSKYRFSLGDVLRNDPKFNRK